MISDIEAAMMGRGKFQHGFAVDDSTIEKMTNIEQSFFFFFFLLLLIHFYDQLKYIIIKHLVE